MKKGLKMKNWCDLSWREKCKIKDGDVNSLSYQTGYSFDVKQKVAAGKEDCLIDLLPVQD